MVLKELSQFCYITDKAWSSTLQLMFITETLKFTQPQPTMILLGLWNQASRCIVYILHLLYNIMLICSLVTKQDGVILKQEC